MTRNSKIVPAVMFHSVGLEGHPWAWSYISEPQQTFERKIALLQREGFTGVFWNDVYDHMAGRRVLPDNSILLTFDDGYLDNWVHVFPVLKKYGMKGTVFVSPDFADPHEDVRPNMDDVAAGRCGHDDLTVAGFLSWAEMREMEDSGIIDIQSHAVTHTWYFCGPEIVDFHQPHDVTPYPWLFWNARRDRKPYYLSEDQQEFLPWGYPILRHQKSLAARQFFPEEDAIQTIVSYVAEHGGRSFFRQSGWRELIEQHVRSHFGGGVLPGEYESEDARAARIADELKCSKKLIEDNLGKKVEFICWPGGANDESVQETATTVGYKSWTLSSSSQLSKKNVPGADPISIKRIGTSNQVNVRGRRCGTAGPHYFMWRIMEHQGSSLHAAAVRAYKLAALALSFGGSR